MMNKKDYKRIIISTLFCLVPILFGLFVYNDLPNQMPIHWDANGTADGFAPKLIGIIALPLILAIINVILQIIVYYDPKRMNISGKMLSLILYILPAFGCIIQTISLLNALKFNIDMAVIAPLITGTLFIVVGNYLPKCKVNYTVGIRLPWTLSDEVNWSKTHRLSGFLFVIVGILLVLNTLINLIHWVVLLMIATTIVLIVPSVYSFMLYKNSTKTS